METASPQLVTVMWTCQVCKRQTVKCEVRARDENEDIKAWVDYAIYRCGRQHNALSPRCHSRHLDFYCKPGADGIIGHTGTASPEIMEEYERILNKKKETPQ